MARNPLPDQIDRLFGLCDDMIDGLEDNPGVGVLQNNAEQMGSVLALAREAEAAFQTSRANRKSKTSAQTLADSNNKAFIGKAKRHLVDSYGSVWKEEWAAVGFVNGSLGIPKTITERSALVVTMKGFFTTNPAKENTESGVTAAAAELLRVAYNTARANLLTAKMQVKDKFTKREEAVDNLETRMRGLIGELETLLPEDSPLWYAFGLNAPGDPETPAIPEEPELTPGLPGSGNLFADWDDTRRADHYRLWRRLPGEADFSPVASVDDSDAMLTAQPSGVAIELRVTAVNGAGESLPGPVAVVTLS